MFPSGEKSALAEAMLQVFGENLALCQNDELHGFNSTSDDEQTRTAAEARQRA